MTVGFAIRDATVDDAEALSVLFIEAWRDEHDGLLPEPVLAARSREESASNWRRSLGRGEDVMLIAGDRPLEGLIVGLLQARAWPGSAEIALVQVARSARRRGLGAALMREAAGRLRRAGAETMIVRVLEANARARTFYETLGGELSRVERKVEESGFWFPERTYVWPDIARLADAS